MSRPGFLQRTFKHRVAILVIALAGVATWALLIRHRENQPVDWSRPHRVSVCPLVAPGSDADALRESFASATPRLEAWAAAQREWWTGTPSQPIDFVMLEPMPATEAPPWLPGPDDSFWTRFRETSRFLNYLEAQAARFPAQEPGSSRIWLYVYRGLDRGAWEDRLSVGTKRGRLGVVFASDDPAQWGNVLCVLMHETLHTVGAEDHRAMDESIAYPSGYADPSATPRLPQKQAEIMALGIPITETDEQSVESLDDVAMGLWTAREIGWH